MRTDRLRAHTHHVPAPADHAAADHRPGHRGRRGRSGRTAPARARPRDGPAHREREWRFDWERDYLLGSEDIVFANTFARIERILRVLGEAGARFEFECYDVGHLYTLAHFLDRGLVQTPLLVQRVLGVLGADPDNLSHMHATAEKLFGDEHCLSAFAAGRHQTAFITQSALLGGHV